MIPKSKVMTEYVELIVGVLFSVPLTNIKNNEMKEWNVDYMCGWRDTVIKSDSWDSALNYCWKEVLL